MRLIDQPIIWGMRIPLFYEGYEGWTVGPGRMTLSQKVVDALCEVHLICATTGIHGIRYDSFENKRLTREPQKDILARTSLKAIQFTEFPTAIDQVVDHRRDVPSISQWYTDSSLRFFLQQAPSISPRNEWVVFSEEFPYGLRGFESLSILTWPHVVRDSLGSRHLQCAAGHQIQRCFGGWRNT